MKTQQDGKNPMVYSELQHLRSQVAGLKKQLENRPASSPAQVGPVVEHRIGPEVLVALRNLLVANENYFGPGPNGTAGPKLNTELASAMKVAEGMVRKVKKP